MKLLLDENISPRVALGLAQVGIDVCHVRDRGILGEPDHAVLERAFAEDRILVTANVADFEKLARSRELHAGIIFLERGDLTRAEQLQVLQRVVERLAQETDLINCVLRVAEDGAMWIEPRHRDAT